MAGAIAGIAVTLLVQNWSLIRGYLPIAAIPTAAVEQDESQPPTEVEFEFYTRLPQMEVPIDTIQEEQRDQADNKHYQYMLQVGSFNRRSDAERMKAQLALLGQVAHIQDVTIKQKSMHRVRLGPFKSSRKLNTIKARLTAEDIPTMALKIRIPD
ncbi:MAG: SPOR domain-containing protein [Immundisolibacteraceae bacterium]|nr:SPOR domain-containing protein [Immundisolibacteraceae bacterium]